MPTVKTALHSTIELLSDKEARQIMRLVELLKEKKRGSLTLRQLAVDMAFQIPSEKNKAISHCSTCPWEGNSSIKAFNR